MGPCECLARQGPGFLDSHPRTVPVACIVPRILLANRLAAHFAASSFGAEEPSRLVACVRRSRPGPAGSSRRVCRGRYTKQANRDCGPGSNGRSGELFPVGVSLFGMKALQSQGDWPAPAIPDLPPVDVEDRGKAAHRARSEHLVGRVDLG